MFPDLFPKECNWIRSDMFRLLFTTAFILLTSLSVYSVKITGEAKGFENRYIRMYSVSDMISRSLVKLDVVKIDGNGRFELNGYLNQTGLVKLKIDDKYSKEIF